MKMKMKDKIEKTKSTICELDSKDYSISVEFIDSREILSTIV